MSVYLIIVFHLIADPLSSFVCFYFAVCCIRLSVGIAYIEQGENHGTTIILGGVSCSAFIHLCRVILSRMINPIVVSLQSDPFWSRRVPLFGTYVSRRLLTPTVFPLQC